MIGIGTVRIHDVQVKANSVRKNKKRGKVKKKGSGVKGEGGEGVERRGEEAWIIHGGFTAGLRQGGSQKYPRLAAWRNNSATEKARHDSSHFCCQSLSAQEVKCLGIITSYCDVSVYSNTPPPLFFHTFWIQICILSWENAHFVLKAWNSAATWAFHRMSL